MRLLDRLSAASGVPLTVVCAPAGYGKTTLAAHLTRLNTFPSVWVTLEKSDDSLMQFTESLVLALQTIDPGLATIASARLAASGAVSPGLVLKTMIDELSEVTNPFFLVIDQYESIQSEEVHRAFSEALARMPETVHLILLSRSSPPLQIARLRSNGEVLDLTREDMQFDIEETRQFLKLTLDLDLSREEAAHLVERTEGWPAALHLLSIAFRGRPKHQIMEAAVDPRTPFPFISDYLWEVAIEPQPPELRDFLLQTSILETFDSDLCDAVTGGANSLDLIEALERDGLFVVRYSGSSGWFRYHSLMSETLRNRLEKATSQETIEELHSRAARHLFHSNHIPEAIEHALAARDWSLAITLLEEDCQPLFAEDRITALRLRLEHLPENIFDLSPRLALFLAWFRTRTGQLALAGEPLRQAEEAFAADGDKAGLGLTMTCRALMSLFRSESLQAADYCQQALELIPEDRTVEREIALLILGIVHVHSGQPVSAEGVFKEVRTLADASGHTWIRMQEMAQSSWALAECGELLEASILCRNVIDAGGESPSGLWIQSALIELGYIYLEWGLLDEAERCTLQALELATLTENALWSSRSIQQLSRVSWAQGKPDDGFAYLTRAAPFALMVSQQELRNVRAQEAIYWVWSGQLALARRWYNSSNLDFDGAQRYERFLEYLAGVRFLISESRADEARVYLLRLEERAEESGRYGDIVQIHTLLAAAEKAQGNLAAAMDYLEQALRAADGKGYFNVFLGDRELLAPLLRRFTGRSSHRDLVHRILATVDGESFAERPDQTGLREPLSDRELEVLRLAASGVSNRLIADRLFISEKTVKKHMSNIMGKLGSSNRTHAVDQARKLGLI